MILRITHLFAFVLVGSSGLGSLIAQDSHSEPTAIAAQINTASQQLLDGKIDEAIAAYEAVAKTSSYNHDLNYNRAIAQYQKGNIELARPLFVDALNSTDQQLAAKSSFNLGNCDYADAIKQSAEDPTAAIQSLDRAIKHYRNALRIDRNDTDARANIELARMLQQKLQENEQQENEQKKDEGESGEQEPDEQESENKYSKDQSPEGQESDRNDEQEKDPNAKDDTGEQKESEAADNENQDASTESNPDQGESGSNPGQDMKSKENPNQESDRQDRSDSSNSSDQEDPSQKQSGEANDSGEAQPDDPSDTAGQEPSDNKPESDDNNSSASSSGQAKPGDEDSSTPAVNSAISSLGDPGKLDQQEAMKMLQAIRDRDLIRRMQQLRQIQSQHIPVEKDW